jgi:hypothetical protein
MARIEEIAAPVPEKSVESSSAVEWASIFGGALAPTLEELGS